MRPLDERNWEFTPGSRNWEDAIQSNVVVFVNMPLRKERGRGPESAVARHVERYTEGIQCKERMSSVVSQAIFLV